MSGAIWHLEPRIAGVMTDIYQSNFSEGRFGFEPLTTSYGQLMTLSAT